MPVTAKPNPASPGNSIRSRNSASSSSKATEGIACSIGAVMAIFDSPCPAIPYRP